MKALSIKEPWASLILSGKKTIETRTWKTNHRGKILLCASKNPKSEISGKAFAIAHLVSIEKMTKAHVPQARCECYPGAFAWNLHMIEPINPFEVKGQLGLFEVNYPQ